MKIFEVAYYTDPLCCWSWAMEPPLRKLRYLLKGHVRFHYIMGGLLKDWNHFNDKMNDIHNPSQLGPLWMEAKRMSGQPLDESLWISNPITTSYPSCMAVKAAQAQSHVAGEAMLRKLREAVMIRQKNIGDPCVLCEIATELENKKILNLKRFETCLFSEEAPRLLQKDLDDSKLKGITRFPTWLITGNGQTVQITGFRPFSVLIKTFKLLDPDLDLEGRIDAEKYRSSWEYITESELEEILVP